MDSLIGMLRSPRSRHPTSSLNHEKTTNHQNLPSFHSTRRQRRRIVLDFSNTGTGVSKIALDSAGDFSADTTFDFTIAVRRPSETGTASTFGDFWGQGNNTLWDDPSVTLVGDSGTRLDVDSEPIPFSVDPVPTGPDGTGFDSEGNIVTYDVTIDLDEASWGTNATTFDDVISNLEAIEIQAEFWLTDGTGGGGGNGGGESALLDTGAVVPEPASYGLIVGSLALTAILVRRRRC